MNRQGKIALVTGAGSGIGRAVALRLQAAGYPVALAGRRLERLEDTAAHAVAGGGEVLTVAADVSRPESVEALFERVRERFGRLDVLFNNAGVSGSGVNTEDVSYEEWSRVVAINLTGSFLCAQQAIR
ncbi:MAG: SDR family NAD(P)-dependent oxidoreductase, partial [Bryobacterales bacterium]|nr:SDR family NAD(P)-dependent oxidoreductase [Bryobacterales bacterium]